MTETPIFRFKFTDDVASAIVQFAKIHQYDDRKTYKEMWKQWCEDNDEIISREITRLNNLGYDGDVHDKMFKAGRYYFRKKDLSDHKTPRPRRNYISMSGDILTAMDTHIKENITKHKFTPATAYDDFCDTNKNMLLDEIKRIFNTGPLTKDDVSNKIKKTYKNRYFIVSRSDISHSDISRSDS
jgi:hypothetical protein